MIDCSFRRGFYFYFPALLGAGLQVLDGVGDGREGRYDVSLEGRESLVVRAEAIASEDLEVKEGLSLSSLHPFLVTLYIYIRRLAHFFWFLDALRGGAQNLYSFRLNLWVGYICIYVCTCKRHR